MKIRTHMEHRSRRLRFVRFLHSRYGLNIQTAYAKIGEWRVKEWECIGVNQCIREFDGKYRGDKALFYRRLHNTRTEFLRFMLTKGMCLKTASKRFRQFDFTELERVGLNEAYRKFLKEYPEFAPAETDETITE